MSVDAALVGRCRAGEEAAMRELVAHFQADVFAVCYRMLRHRQDAEDVSQEVFVRVFRSMSRWDESRPLKPWILAIAINRCKSWAGKRSRQPELIEYLHDTPDPRPERDDAELTRAVREGVDALREDYRLVFVLYHEQGQSYEDVATALGRPVGTIKTWLHRARLELLDQLRTRGFILDKENEQ